MQLLEYIRDFRKVTVGERVTRYESIKRNIGTSHARVCVYVSKRKSLCTLVKMFDWNFEVEE